LKQLLRLQLFFTGFVLILLTVSTALMLPLGEQLPKTERLAFMASVGDNDDVYVMDLSRSLIARFTSADTWERFPTWSPDGESLAYHSGPGRQPGCTINYEIFVSSLDGRSTRQITGRNLLPYQTPAFNGFETSDFIRCAAMPDWSPDGTKIAFHANPAGQWDIFVYDLVTNSLTQVTKSLDDDVLFDWALDSRSGVYATGIGTIMTLNRINIETGELTPLTSFADVMSEDGFVNTPTGTLADWHPTFSPDGSQIVFMSDRDGAQDIYVMDADGTNLRNLTADSFTDTNPVWTADGRIIFTSDRIGVSRLFIIDPDSGDIELLIGWNFPYLLDGAAYWSPAFNTSANNSTS
jgi:Tol biopolymer transport system component